MQTDPIILYIVGLGHSGSTLLDLLLGSHSQITGVGELKVLSQRSVRNRIRKGRSDPHATENMCTCGAPRVAACPFWQAVEALVQAEAGLALDDLDLYHEEAAAFAVQNRAILQAISTVSGSRYIVDSSKDVDRLQRLLAAGCFDVRPIHLMRSPHGVVYSNVKKGRSWLKYAYQYKQTTARIRGLLAGREHLIVHYEALASTPLQTLAGILSWLGTSVEPGQLDWTRYPRHNIAGNNMRFGADSAIVLDETWKVALPLWQRLAISWITSWR